MLVNCKVTNDKAITIDFGFTTIFEKINITGT